ncbi:hypothetical protein BLNAU_7787 [Blattamonas nauphoetae]|uniref:Uncharacterized protein n=1 Tax=Blattamonas nauphoetae TaxID=2049346 RepID=A0ABQ9Y0D5_9EUKA|nr:hypothetical protein BLNAU_7787 [Blattamonas nauphoetae]
MHGSNPLKEVIHFTITGQDMKGSGADIPTVSIYPVGKKTAENTVALSNVEVLEGNTVVKANYHRTD